MVIKEALEAILNTSLQQESCWFQSTSPGNLGGLGNRLAYEIALPAYLSSVQASLGATYSLLSPEIQQETNLFFEKGCDDWILKFETTELPTYQFFSQPGINLYVNINARNF